MPIGTLNEGPLHASLKAAYSANGGEEEVAMEGFVADAVRGGIVYEIQTGSFSGLGRKMKSLADAGPVVLVHPIARDTFILKQGDDPEAKPLSRRKSPKHGALIHIVRELVYIPTLLNHPNFSVEVVLTDEEEVRVYDPKMRRRRGGWRVIERRLLEIVEGRRLSDTAELFDFAREELPEVFGTRELAQAIGQPVALARQMAYCLREAGVTELCGKKGNALQYRCSN